MPKGTPKEDATMLHMALLGYESERKRIDEKIAELRGRIGRPGPGRPPGSRKQAASETSEGPSNGRKRRTLSASARKRIAAAQKKRWAEHRKSVETAE